MTLRQAIFKFGPIALGLGAALAWAYLDQRHRSMPIAASVLASWWFSLAAYFGALFAGTALAFFLPHYKKFDRPILIGSICNLFAAWLFIAMYFIVSDASVYPLLVGVGLGSLCWIFLFLGLLWACIFFYQFAFAVDALSRRAAPDLGGP